MYLPSFQYLAPKDTGELTALLSDHGDNARILSGGTDLLVQLKNSGADLGYVIDISGLEELSEISYDDTNGLVIGAAAKLDDIMDLPVVKEKYFALYQAIETIGARQIRTMGSLGGNICNASPAADTPPALVAFNAEVSIASDAAERQMPLVDFIQGNRKTDLGKGEYLKSITLPVPAKKSGSAYHHFRVRGGMEIAMVATALSIQLEADNETVKDAVIALGVVGPAPIKAEDAAKILIGQKPNEELLQSVSQACADISQPIDDFRASAEYRKEILRVLIEEAFDEAYAQVAG
jgi:aerobic carbon-monoxide dehydrogenase medium subunit